MNITTDNQADCVADCCQEEGAGTRGQEREEEEVVVDEYSSLQTK